MQSNIVLASNDLLRLLGVKYSPQYVEHFLIADKDYPSLSSISALLNNFSIENIAVKINDQQLRQISVPSVAFTLKGRSGHFVVVSNLKEDTITYLDDNNEISETISEFCVKWQSVILLAQAHNYSVSKDNDDYVREKKEKTIQQLVGSAVMITFIASIFTMFPISPIFFLSILIQSVAFTSSIILLSKDLGFSAAWVDSICRMNGLVKTKVGCDGVKNSKASNFLGIIKMSEIGVLYFGSTWLLLVLSLINSMDQQAYSFLLILTSCAVPYTMFSIYYQFFVIKEACPFCILVVMCIWFEFVLLVLLVLPEPLKLSANLFPLVVISFGVPLLFWLSVRAQLFKMADYKRVRRTFKVLSSSPKVLSAVLDEQSPKLNDSIKTPIILNAGNDIVVSSVLSYFCPSCTTTFREIIQLASRNKNIQFEIVMSSFDNASASLSRTLLNRKFKNGDSSAIEFLSAWYDKNVSVLNSGPDFDEQIVSTLNETIAAWNAVIEKNFITSIPTVFINRSLKPRSMSISDFELLFKNAQQRRGT